ncbi:MAG: YchJ family protein [Oxalobacter sp.]
MAKKTGNTVATCPCGGASFRSCCEPYLEDGVPAPTALALMRSRYSAFVTGNEAYLRETWLAENRPSGVIIEKKDPVKWVGLKILRHQELGDRATVEFIASYKRNGRMMALHENSLFIRENGHWYYVDGTFF